MALQPQILGIIAIILGAFIIFSFLSQVWRGAYTQVEYNIGCYAEGGSLNHTQQLVNRLNVIKQSQYLSQSYVYKYRSLIQNETQFHQQSVQLALSFERYIQVLTENQDQRRENMNILLAIKQAQKEFLDCKAEIDEHYVEEDCKRNWWQYENCFSEVQKLRQQLNYNLAIENTIKDEIDLYIRLPNNKESAIKIAQRRYNESIRINDRKRQQLLSKSDYYEKEKKAKIFMREESSSKLNGIEKPYRECVQNRKEHRNCEQIAKSINTLDYGSIGLLKERIEYKKHMLAKLLLVLGKPEDRKSMEVLIEEYRKHAEEYKRMLKTFIEATQQINKACGCTEEYEISLANEFRKIKEEVNALSKDISRLEELITKTDYQINQNERQREAIIAEYRKVVNETEITGSEHIESELMKLKRKLQESNQQTLLFKDGYNSVNRQCQEVKRRMTVRIKDVDKIELCLRKKEYFGKLKAKGLEYLHPDGESNQLQETRLQLAKFLHGFGQL